MNDPQLQYLLVRYCVGAVKFCYAVRNSPPSRIPASIAKMDLLLAESLQKIVGVDVSEDDCIRAGLSVKLGGLGIPRIANMAMSAYVGSLAQSCDTQATILGCTAQELHPAIDALLAGFYDKYLPQQPRLPASTLTSYRKPQELLSDLVSTFERNQLCDRYRSQGLPLKLTSLKAVSCISGVPGAFLSALPSPALGTYMSPTYFQIALRHHLGLDIYDTVLVNGSRLSPICSVCEVSPLDPAGLHALSCGGQSGFIYRHDSIRDQLHKICQEARINSAKEARGLLGSQNMCRPGDVFIKDLRGPGDDVAIDVNVKSIPSIGDNFDHVTHLLDAAAAKNNKFKQACTEANINFVPLVFNTYGAIHRDTGPDRERDGLLVLKQIANRFASLHDMNYATAKNRIIQRISFALKRGVIDQLCRRLPPTDQHPPFSLECVRP